MTTKNKVPHIARVMPFPNFGEVWLYRGLAPTSPRVAVFHSEAYFEEMVGTTVEAYNASQRPKPETAAIEPFIEDYPRGTGSIALYTEEDVLALLGAVVGVERYPGEVFIVPKYREGTDMSGDLPPRLVAKLKEIHGL